MLSDARRDFATMVAHDLRTPLTVIRGAVAELEAHGDSERVRRQLRVATDVLAGHAEMVIDMARLDAGEYASTLVKCDVAEEISRLCELAESLATGKPLTIRSEIVSPCVVSFDVCAFRHIVQNLIENAVKYTERGTIVVRGNVGNGTLTIQVQDSGMGLSAEELAHVGDLFYRGAGDRVRAKMGTGMGLWMSRRFAEACGGSLHIESAGVDQGTTCTLTVPCAG